MEDPSVVPLVEEESPDLHTGVVPKEFTNVVMSCLDSADV